MGRLLSHSIIAPEAALAKTERSKPPAKAEGRDLGIEDQSFSVSTACPRLGCIYYSRGRRQSQAFFAFFKNETCKKCTGGGRQGHGNHRANARMGRPEEAAARQRSARRACMGIAKRPPRGKEPSFPQSPSVCAGTQARRALPAGQAGPSAPAEVAPPAAPPGGSSR